MGIYTDLRHPAVIGKILFGEKCSVGFLKTSHGLEHCLILMTEKYVKLAGVSMYDVLIVNYSLGSISHSDPFFHGPGKLRKIRNCG